MDRSSLAIVVDRTASNHRPSVDDKSAQLDSEHHACVFVLEVVAMDHIGLLAWEGTGEVERNLHAFAWPDEHGVLAAEIGGEASAIVHLERRNRIGTGLALQQLEVEAVQV